MTIIIEITPQPVVLGQPWHVKISGLHSGQDRIVLGNGYDDGNNMLHTEFTADANGVIEVDPPPLVIRTGTSPVGPLKFNVLQMLGSHGNWKELATQMYQCVAA